MADLIDHAFAPLRTRFDRVATKYLKARPDTKVEPANRRARKRMRTLPGFIDQLGDPDIEFPVGNLLLVTHANGEGWFQVPISGRRGTSFEALEDAVDNGSIVLPDGLFEGSGEDPVFRIVGCSVGQAPIFVDKLREALGGNVHVRAARFLTAIGGHASGYFEYLTYSLSMTSKKKLRRRSEVVDAFNALEHHYYDGQLMPAELIAQWIPRKVRRSRSRLKKVAGARPELGRSINRQTRLSQPVTFQVKKRTIPGGRARFTMAYAPGSSAPRSKLAQIEVIRDEVLATAPDFQDDHEFPVYKRFGHESLEDFMQAWDWKIKRRKRLLAAKAVRYEYRIEVPLVDVDTGMMLFHYVPRKPTRSDTQALELLPEDNPQLFYTSR